MSSLKVTGMFVRKAASVLTIGLLFATLLQAPAQAGVGDPDAECQANGFDFGIEKWSPAWTLDEEGSAGADYTITVSGTRLLVTWTSSPAVAGVLAKAGTLYAVLPGGTSGTISVASLPILQGHELSHITFCGNNALTPVTASAVLGACVFANGASTSPVTALISPAGGATVALSNAGGVVHTFPTSGATYNAAPGAYTWVATAAAGYAISGASTGGFTA
ncbi:MAG: hypothetical protein ABIS18_08845, partial [Actinomycetota bacterium]